MEMKVRPTCDSDPAEAGEESASLHRKGRFLVGHRGNPLGMTGLVTARLLLETHGYARLSRSVFNGNGPPPRATTCGLAFAKRVVKQLVAPL